MADASRIESREIQRLEDAAASALAAWWKITTGDTELEDVARRFLKHDAHVRGSTSCPALAEDGSPSPWSDELTSRSLGRLERAAGPEYERDVRIVARALGER